jgi:hypothetical protein
MEHSMPARYDQGTWRERLRRGNRASGADLEGAAASASELSDVTALRGAE